MKNFKKQAIPAIFMLLMAIISLTGVTFAWFSDAKDASVKNININITESSGVAISLEGTGSYAKYVDLDTVTSGETLSPVSAFFETKNKQEAEYTKVEVNAWEDETDYYKMVGGVPTLVDTEAETTPNEFETYYLKTQIAKDLVLPNWYVASKGETNGKLSSTSSYGADSNTKGYMTISLFFETLSSAKEVYFLGNGVSVAHDFASDKSATSTDARSALRIAFVVYETSAAKKAGGDYNTVKRTVIVEPFATEHNPARGASAVAEDYYAITAEYLSATSTYTAIASADCDTKAEYDAIAKYYPLFYKNGESYVKTTEFSMEEARTVTDYETWLAAKSSSKDTKIYTLNSLTGEYVEATTYTPAVEGASPVPQPTYYVQRQFYKETKPEVNQVPADASDAAIGVIYKKCETYKVNEHSLEASASSSGTVQSLFTVGQGYTRVDMYIWLEGQDLDCIDSITLEDLIMNINLFCLDEGK